MSATLSPFRSPMTTGRDTFGALVHAEWTKFRTVRGWVVAVVVAALIPIGFGVLVAAGSQTSCMSGTVEVACPPPLVGPDGEVVSDSFYFAHQSLDGDGAVTARITSLTGGLVSRVGGQFPANLDSRTPITGEVTPWAKAGLILKADTTPGSAYAAIMVTGGHGVRMQHNFTADDAGPAVTVSGAAPQWLRLTRADDTITGFASADGISWTTVGNVTLADLGSTAQAGMFITSPVHQDFEQKLGGGGSATGGPTLATASFDSIAVQGRWASAAWDGLAMGDGPGGGTGTGSMKQADGTITLTGSGDIAPDIGSAGATIEQNLSGAFAMLIIMVVLGVLFVSTEFRRGMIRTSLTGSPRRERVLAAKAIVIAAVTFAAGLIAAAITVPLANHLLREGGNFIHPTTWLTEVRVVVGTAALLAVSAVLALAVGTIVRRSAGAVAAVGVLIMLPYITSAAGVLPADASQWLLRLTPAAGFAIQQTLVEYPQVSQAYTPAFGFYPLAPLAGFAVLCGYAAVALVVATYLLRRRDA